MKNNKVISLAVIRRLPRYYRYLKDLLEKDINRISSSDLSALMNITASQIRQDLSNFGSFGQQGYGYNVEYLLNEIKRILNIDNSNNLIIIGIGNIGSAITKYINNQKNGMKIIGLFDKNKDVIGKGLEGFFVQDVETLPLFLKKNKVDMVALTIPSKNIKEITRLIVEHDVKGVWNFSSHDLDLPPNIVVENVNLSDDLMILNFRVNQIINKV